MNPYKCDDCGATGVKLWREYQTFADRTSLACAACAETSQQACHEPGWRSPFALGQGDRIGWRVPAIPSDGGFWGYTSVPPDRFEWWQGLPTIALPSPEVTSPALVRCRSCGALPNGLPCPTGLLGAVHPENPHKVTSPKLVAPAQRGVVVCLAGHDLCGGTLEAAALEMAKMIEKYYKCPECGAGVYEKIRVVSAPSNCQSALYVSESADPRAAELRGAASLYVMDWIKENWSTLQPTQQKMLRDDATSLVWRGIDAAFDVLTAVLATRTSEIIALRNAASCEATDREPCQFDETGISTEAFGCSRHRAGALRGKLEASEAKLAAVLAVIDRYPSVGNTIGDELGSALAAPVTAAAKP